MTQSSWTDREIRGIREDRLAFGEYSQVLAEVAWMADTPLTVGIFGPWGSGKSSLMRLVQEELPRTYTYKSPITVWFNAWHYDKEEALWRALIIRVLSALRPPKKEGQEASEEQKRLISKLDELEARLYRVVEREEIGGVTVDWNKLVKGTIMGSVHFGLNLIPGLAAFSKLVEKAQEQIAGEDVSMLFDAIQREKQRIYREHIRSMETFKDEFAKLVQTEVVAKDRRLVVFIDDLDRCMPEKAIEVLEALKLFLDVEGCVFFLGADREVIQRGIQVKYQGFLLDSDDPEVANRRIPISGDNYLEKIIQLPFHLLPLDESRIESFIDESGYDISSDCSRIFAVGLEANPRKVKRALNMFLLLQKVADIRRQELQVEGKPVRIQLQLLAKMVVIQNRYRDLYHDLVETPSFLSYLERHFQGQLAKEQAQEMQVDSRYPEWIQKYQHRRPLQRLLTTGESFADLSPTKVKLYLYLTYTTEEGRLPDEASQTERWWRDLLSNDAVRIRQGATTVQREGDEVVASFRQQLIVAIEQRSALTYSWEEYLSMGRALAWLGDLRDLTEMIPVPMDRYRIGEEGEPRQVFGFSLGKYLVTNQQYKQFLDEHLEHPVPDDWDPAQRTYPEGKANHPAVYVSWEDAQAYCRWQNKRLPTDDEWEAAARGTQGTVYPYGNEVRANAANTAELELGDTSPVGAFPEDVSPLAVMDMTGNVSEWTATPAEDENGEYVIKGGNWQEPVEMARCRYTRNMAKTEKTPIVGFRVTE